MYWLTNLIVRIYTRITCRIDGINELKNFPGQGPLIAISNHTGQIEVPLIFAHLYPRPVTGWAKVEAWNNWFLRWIFGVWGIIPVHRGEADMKALKDALNALKEGKILGIAPEGTRNKTGKLIRAMPGTVIVALKADAPIIPIAHWGGEVYLRNLMRLKRTDFHLRVGKPFKIELNSERVTSEIRQQIVDEMMYEIAKMMPEEYRGEYSDMSKATQNYIKYTE